MAKKKSTSKPGKKNTKKRPGRGIFKGRGMRTRRSAVQKSGKTDSGEPLKGPKEESSRAAKVAGKLIKAVSRAKTIKEANDLLKQMKSVQGLSKRGEAKRAKKLMEAHSKVLYDIRKARKKAEQAAKAAKTAMPTGRSKKRRRKPKR